MRLVEKTDMDENGNLTGSEIAVIVIASLFVVLALWYVIWYNFYRNHNLKNREIRESYLAQEARNQTVRFHESDPVVDLPDFQEDAFDESIQPQTFSEWNAEQRQFERHNNWHEVQNVLRSD